MKVIKFAFVIALASSFFVPMWVDAQQNAGGRGLMYVHSARSIGKGNLNAYLHSRFFGKVGSSVTSVTYWDVQGSFTLNYGLSDRFELSLFPIIYQDTNRSGGGINIPDDLFIKLKIGSLGSASSKLKFGVMTTTRIPIASEHNIIFEPYSAGTVSVGFTGMASYADDLLFPDKSFNLHINLGYIFHNDAGNTLTDNPLDDISNVSVSSEGIFGIGIRNPFDKWDVGFEVNGNIWIQNPATTAYSRENYIYLTPSVTYKLLDWFHINIGGDFRLTGDRDETIYNYNNGAWELPTLPQQLPSSYPDWRGHLGLKIAFTPSSMGHENEKDLLVRKAETRREVFEQIVREQNETAKAERELERIKTERMKAEQELQRLRRLLEDNTEEKTKEKSENTNE